MRTRWFLLVVVLGLFAGLLLLNGVVTGGFAEDGGRGRTGATGRVPRGVLDGGPIISANGDRVHTLKPPARKIVLTFDDGPDPTRTPEILSVLAKHDVPAVFFMVGSQIGAHPGIVRNVRNAGHEIGVHTFTHPDLAGQGEWRRRIETRETRLALAGAAGVSSVLFRPPYSSTAAAFDDRTWPVVAEAAANGYLTVVHTLDSRDREAGATLTDIRRAVMPAGGEGAIVLFHDGGGDRSRTAPALDAVIPELKRAGYTFTTIAELTGRSTVNPPATLSERALGLGLVGAVQAAGAVSSWFAVLLLVLGVLILARPAVLLVLARRHARRDPGRWGPAYDRRVTVIVPVHNAKERIAGTLGPLVAGDHPAEIVVVDDGSTDGTADLAEALGHPNVTVLRQPNAGRAAALNTGIAHATTDVVVMSDGDTIFETDTVRRLVQPFADPAVGAVAGNATVANRAGTIALWQHIENVAGAGVDRRAFDVLHCTAPVPGAIGAFRREALRQVDGLSGDTLAEDTDLTIAIIRAGWRVVYEERARAWTEAPATVRGLWRQWYRSSHGTMQAIWKHRRALIESGPGGRFGRRALLMLTVFQTLLPLLSPLIDVYLIYGLLFGNPAYPVAVWLGVLAVQLIGAGYAFRLDGESLRPLWRLPLQQFVHRQAMYLVLIQALAATPGGIRPGWQQLRRTGGLNALLGARLPTGSAATTARPGA